MFPILKLDNVTKIYKRSKVVDSISFSLCSGQVFGIIGPNGAGKSTTIKMICGLTSISGGAIYINGYNVERCYEKAIENVGAVVETPHFYDNMTGLANLNLYASFYDKSVLARIPKIVKLVGLDYCINQKVATYSLGMKQRLGIAQALINKPKLLILDEPTNGLAPEGIIEIRNLIKTLAQKEKIAIIISSHNLKELEYVCDEIAVISNGKIVSYRSMNEIKALMESRQKVCFFVNYPNLAGQLINEQFKLKCKVAGNAVIAPIQEKDVAKVISFLFNNKIKIYKTKKINLSLEEIYFNILNKKNSPTTLF